MLITEVGVGENERGDPELAGLAGGFVGYPTPDGHKRKCR